MAIATDRVDDAFIGQPHRWNIRFIRTFMLTFGVLSSVFDYLTFAVLLLGLQATTEQFRTAWFAESVLSASLVVLVIRSRQPFFKSKPGRSLLLAPLLIVGIILVFPFTPLLALFGFRPLSLWFLVVLGVIVSAYVGVAEIAKRIFYKRVNL